MGVPFQAFHIILFRAVINRLICLLLIVLSGMSAVAQSVRFDGVNDCVSVGHDSRLATEQFTVETWFKRESGGDFGFIAGNNAYPLISRGSGANYFLGISISGQLCASLFPTKETWKWVAGGPVIPVGEWHHGAATFDGRDLRIFLNGQQVGEVSLNANLEQSVSTGYLGTRLAQSSAGQNPDGRFAGQMAEARIWNLARSAVEIAATRFSKIQFQPGLLGRWGLDTNQTNFVSDGTSQIPSVLENGAEPRSDGPALLNIVPSTTLVAPQGAQIVTLGDTVALSATASDPDDAIARVEFYSGHEKIGEDGDAPYELSWSPLHCGVSDIRAMAVDLAGNRNGASVGARVTVLQTLNPEALLFDGMTNRVDLAASAALAPTEFTVEASFYMTGDGTPMLRVIDGGAHPIVGLVSRQSREYFAYMLGIRPNDNRLVGFTGSYEMVARTPISRNKWHHAALTFDGVTLRMFLDGKLECEERIPYLYNETAPTYSQIGAIAYMPNGGFAGYGGTFEGFVDEVRIWDYARPGGAIDGTRTLRVINADGLLSRWGFDEAGGATATGVGSAPVDGTLVGAFTRGGGIANTIAPVPQVTLEAPGGAVALTRGTNQVFEATVTNGGGAIERVEFWDQRQKLGEDATSPYRLMWTAAPTGLHQIRAVAIDSQGVAGTSEAVRIQVNPQSGAGAMRLFERSDTPSAFVQPGKLNAFTFEFRFRREEIGESGGSFSSSIPAEPLARMSFGGVGSEWLLGFRKGDGALVALRNGEVQTIASAPVALGEWHHAAITCDGTFLRMYLNGQFQGEHVLSKVVLAEGVVVVNFGGNNVSGRFVGDIGEVRVWDYSRSGTEIRGNVAQALISEPGLLSRWGFSEGAGTATAGAGSAGAVMTLNGAEFVAGPPPVVGAPQVAITSPGPGSSFPINVELPVICSALDGGAGVARVELYLGHTLVGTDDASPYEFVVTPTVIRPDRLRAVAVGHDALTSTFVLPVNISPPLGVGALYFDGVDDHVVMDPAPVLAAERFTVETWMRKEGAGKPASSVGGVSPGVPLIVRMDDRGAIEVSANYALGLVTDVDGKDYLCGRATVKTKGGSFEVGGVNGRIPLEPGVWNHVAMTFDGSEFRLYVNGVLDRSSPTVDVPVTGATMCTSWGAAVTSSGRKSGAFHGYLDEVRIWNYARSGEAIAADRWRTIFSDPALLGQWSMQEVSGGAIPGSGAAMVNGTMFGAVMTGEHPVVASPAPFVGLAVSGTPILGNTLNLTATPTPGSGVVDRVEFFANGAKLGEAAAAPWAWSFTPPKPGRYQMVAIVQDSSGGHASSAEVLVDIGREPGVGALYFDGEDDYAELNPRAELASATGTIETWLRPDGFGRFGSWHSTFGRIAPIIASGSISIGLTETGHIVATNEISQISSVAIPIGEWTHVAIVFNGVDLRIYLNGSLAGSIAKSALINRSTLSMTFGAALDDSWARRGAFHGSLEEVRIWSVARTAQQIAASRDQVIETASGLVARYGFEEPSGSQIRSTTGGAFDAIIRNGVERVSGLTLSSPPKLEIGELQPAQDEVRSVPVALEASVKDASGGSVQVSFSGREIPRRSSDFTIVVLPESKNYTASLNGGSPAMLRTMLEWIVANRAMENIVCVIQTGEIATGGLPAFAEASSAFALLEDPATTGLPTGIPYLISSPATISSQVASHFGSNRPANRPWYGGPDGLGVSRGITLFNAGGIDFAVVESASAAQAESAVTWPNRQFIVVSDDPSIISSAMNSVKVPLILSVGASSGESRSLGVSAGRTYNHLTANFADRPNGGDGWMRLLRFSPTTGQMSVRTWSPTKGAFETDGNSDFTTPWNSPLLAKPSSLIAQASVLGEGNASVSWAAVQEGRQYEWTAEAARGGHAVRARAQTFHTAPAVNAQAPVVSLSHAPASTNLILPTTAALMASVSGGESPIESVEWFVNGTLIESDPVAPYTMFWKPGAAGAYEVVAVAVDRGGVRGSSQPLQFTVSPAPSTIYSINVAVTPLAFGNTLYDSATIPLSAAAGGSFTTVASVDFFANGVWIGSDASSPYQIPWTYGGQGTIQIHAMATSTSGVRLMSSPYAVNVTPLLQATATRSPALFRPSPDAVTVRWRTSQIHPGRVWYGLSPTSMTSFVDEASPGTNHVVRLTGLLPNTRYYYGVGTPSSMISDNRNLTTFTTPPAVGRAKASRIWVIGDAGQGNAGQASTRDGYLAFAGSKQADILMTLGDQAYNTGASTDFQTKFFDPYASILKRTFCFSTVGDRDTAGSTTYNGNISYYTSFLMPSAGESGGVASGTDRYYSFDYGSIHFVCLDSQTSDRSALGAMATWLRSDLQASAARWKIAFWHHPPYSKGGQDSDVGVAQSEMRSIFGPILEEYGVDLVLGSHSRNYERSWPIAGHTGLANTFVPSMKKASGSGNPATDGAYLKTSPAGGTVYAVVGNAATLDTGASLAHPAMAVSRSELGSAVIDVHGSQLDFRMINSSGSVSDHFTILKPWTGPDADGDGLPDEYEQAYGFDRLFGADAQADFDGDGARNLDEFITGTDPLDAKSRLAANVMKEGGEFTIRFSSVPGVRYGLEYSETLVPGSWLPIGLEVTGTGLEAAIRDIPPFDEPHRFYRVRARQ